ncbi:MAG: glycosyltransferase [Planctomycetota bacterium]
MTDGGLSHVEAVFVQFGDFAEAAQRFAQGGQETYYAQRYSVEAVEALADVCKSVTVVCLGAQPASDVALSSGVRVVNLGFDLSEKRNPARLCAALRGVGGTHWIVRVVSTPVLKAGLAAGVRVLPLWADSFRKASLLDGSWLRQRALAKLLQQDALPWIANHNLAATRDLERLGVDPGKLLPWDWPPQRRPTDYSPRTAPDPSSPRRLLYAGALALDKGINDLIRAAALLKQQGRDVRVTIAGPGEPQDFTDCAVQQGVSDRVELLGRVPHSRVLEEMRRSDAVVVPIWHSYPEGLPMVIYDALCTRTPLLISDHPMFLARLRAGDDALVFAGQNPTALAERAAELFDRPDLFARLSENTAEAWARIQCPLKWGALVERWLADGPDDRRYLGEHSLATGRYEP